MIKILFALTLFLFTLGQLGRITPFEIPVFSNLYEIGLFSVGIYLFTTYRFSPEVFKNSVSRSAIVFFSWLLISLVISFFYYPPISNLLAGLYFIRFLSYVLFFFYFFHYLRKNTKEVPFYVRSILIAGLVIIVFSLIQYFLYPNLGNLAYQGWDPHLYRLVGLFFDPPVTASVLFLLGLFFYFSNINVYLKYSFMITVAILFFLTYSRGGFLALLITLGVFSLRNMKWQYLLAGMAIMVGVYVIIPKNLSEGLNLARTTSIETRLKDYHKAIRIWQKNPVLGIGYNHIRFEKDSYEEEIITERYNPSHASSSFHSSFLMILVTAGVIGLVLYLWFIGSLAAVSPFAFYSIMFLSVFSLTDNVLLHPFILFLLFVLMSVESQLDFSKKHS